MRRSGAMVRWYFKVLVRSTSLLPKTLMRGVPPQPASSSTSAFAGCKRLTWTFQLTLRPAAVPGCSLLDRLPCLRASRTTADLPACCFSARSPPNTTLVGLAAPKRSRFLASAEVPRPLLFLRRVWAVYARCSAPVLRSRRPDVSSYEDRCALRGVHLTLPSSAAARGPHRC